MRPVGMLLVLMSASLAACAGTSVTAWNKPQTSIDQWHSDDKACRDEASATPNPSGGWASYDADKLTDLTYGACLRGLGYSQVALNQVQLTAITVATFEQRRAFTDHFAVANRPGAVNPLQNDR